MRIPELVLAALLAGCATNPDPRPRSIDHVIQDGHGAWIDVTLRGGGHVAGELIALDSTTMTILALGQVARVGRPDVVRADLWAYETQQNRYLAYGLFGTATTVSHGFFLVFSAPAWLITTSLVMAIESRGALTQYPGDAAWQDLAIWGRFPQGMPPGLPDAALVHQVRPSPTVPPGLVPDAPTP